ncbi:MAG: SPOR domain-containing protein, partial [Alphaproteobacteria bacterium]|nr:SPOR domain-containing protein [Alphaproteobacteria bacterium]
MALVGGMWLEEMLNMGLSHRAGASLAVATALAMLAGFAPGALATKAGKEQVALARLAAESAATAQVSLQAGNVRRAIRAAERAVAAMPRSASYRVQLGQAYFTAGRFASAEMAFQDALTLDPNNSVAVLKLALSQIALGKAQSARDLLERHQSELAISDYGLAMALSGDADAALAALVPAVRAGDANARLRQNLALAFALAGRWEDARAMALVDLPPEAVDVRLKQWADMAHPAKAGAQIASLMGLKAIEDGAHRDPGQPADLALNMANSLPQELALRASPTEVGRLSFDIDGLDADAAAAAEQPKSHYDVPPEVKDPVVLPASFKRAAMLAPAAGPSAVWARALQQEGGFVVQIGAFRTAQAAARGQAVIAKRWAHAPRYAVHQARVQGAKGAFYRLSLGRFASLAEASRVCADLRAKGGA